MKALRELGLVLGLLVGHASDLSADVIITGSKDGAPKTARKDPYTVSLRPIPVEHINGPTAADLKLLNDTEAARPGRQKKNKGTWEFKKGDAASGTFEVLQYAAFIDGDLGGADFVVRYDDGVAQERTDYSWIQIARPEDWGSAGNAATIDSGFSDFPFYATYIPSSLATLKTSDFPSRNPSAIFKDTTNFPHQNIQNPDGGGKIKAGDLMFWDEPFCPLSCADKDGHAQDVFDLFLVEFIWNGQRGAKAGGTITIRDGMRWGVEITCDDDPEGDDTVCNVPEPSQVVLMLFVFVAAAVDARRRSTACGTRPQ